ncbi:M14 family zinc carboxypeptidase [Microcystis aeruginosa]|uniref:M14 family zinc carboxypeptidase n=1 Tax=Microcystis aeruginosa TaxID=1126 RepID=UPI00164A0A8E|nr:M14 family zinc carboxypeptidase [Microcystis aeruginosa]
MESSLDGLVAAYPSLCELIELPHLTYEGRTSHALRIGTEPSTNPGVLFIGGVHAREWGSCEISIYFAADLLEAYQKGTGLVYGGKSFSATQIKTITESFTSQGRSPSKLSAHLRSRTVGQLYRQCHC